MLGINEAAMSCRIGNVLSRLPGLLVGRTSEETILRHCSFIPAFADSIIQRMVCATLPEITRSTCELQLPQHHPLITISGIEITAPHVVLLSPSLTCTPRVESWQ